MTLDLEYDCPMYRARLRARRRQMGLWFWDWPITPVEHSGLSFWD